MFHVHGTSVNNLPFQVTFAFGNRKISLNRVKRARHGKPSILASELTAMVWTPEEMALSTLNGKKGQLGKMQLEENLVDAVISMYDFNMMSQLCCCKV